MYNSEFSTRLRLRVGKELRCSMKVKSASYMVQSAGMLTELVFVSSSCFRISDASERWYL